MVDIKILFQYEMMDTPTLANECFLLREAIDEETHNMFLGNGETSHKRELMARLKAAKRILKSRQLKLF